MGYVFLEHTADVKFRAVGSTKEEMFVFAAEALNEVIRGDIKIAEMDERSFEVGGDDVEGLLYNFLEEFLFLLDAEDFLMARVRKIEIAENKICCVVVGDSASSYHFTNDVKAITYSEMKVEEKDGGFESFVVLDV